MIGAKKAQELSAQGFAQKHAELRECIYKKIEAAAIEGRYDCNINDSLYLDEALRSELHMLGYKMKYHWSDWGGFYTISWEAK